MTVLPPPKISDYRYGQTLNAGNSRMVVIADFDFETYSPAGFVWNREIRKWGPLPQADEKGLNIVDTVNYTQHPDAEVLSLSYDLKDGNGIRLWVPGPGKDNPRDLFEHLAQGKLLEAWNVAFEYFVWQNICVPKYGWPPLPVNQLRCAMAKSRAFALPGSLAKCGDVLNTEAKKDKMGEKLLKIFSIPRDPTKNDARLRIRPEEDPENARLLYQYNIQDVKTEFEISTRIPDLIPSEVPFWQCDLDINIRGVQVDTSAVTNCIRIIEQAHARYNGQLYELTNGVVDRASKTAKLVFWLREQLNDYSIKSIDADNVARLLKTPGLPSQVIKALEIRAMINSAAVKKVYSMRNQVSKTGRLHNLFVYHSARTGRAAGRGPQPQNLPNSGDCVLECTACSKRCGEIRRDCCPWCGHNSLIPTEWDMKAVENALEVINTGSVDCVEYYFGNSISTISGCLRSLFIAAPGHDLICSDYSAIEAVVLAELAGESWRQEVFNTHGKIYEMSASKITGIPFEEYERYKQQHGTHHPTRKTIGKVAELASGYGGWTGAWRNFGADEFFNEDQMKEAILAWRNASPKIVEYWGGQKRNWAQEFYGIEGMALRAILQPGEVFEFRGIKFQRLEDVLYCTLLSGRQLTYHRILTSPSMRRPGQLEISYEGWNSNPKNGPIGWIRMKTYGGKLVENIVQATARDILAHAIINLEAAGYPVVLHVHDEIASEVPEDFGSVEEFEKIMSTMPAWAAGWPVKASGGWRGKRYRK